jgi:hypothetical protein
VCVCVVCFRPSFSPYRQASQIGSQASDFVHALSTHADECAAAFRAARAVSPREPVLVLPSVTLSSASSHSTLASPALFARSPSPLEGNADITTPLSRDPSSSSWATQGNADSLLLPSAAAAAAHASMQSRRGLLLESTPSVTQPTRGAPANSARGKTGKAFSSVPAAAMRQTANAACVSPSTPYSTPFLAESDTGTCVCVCVCARAYMYIIVCV